MKHRILEALLNGQISYKGDIIQSRAANFQNLLYPLLLQDLILSTALYNAKVNGYTE